MATEKITGTHLDEIYLVAVGNMHKFTDWQIDQLYHVIYPEVMKRNLGEHTEFEEIEEGS